MSSSRISHLRMLVDPPGRLEWLADHALTVEEALPMMTIAGAYALFREDEVGSLAPGKLADLLILSGDPLSDPRRDQGPSNLADDGWRANRALCRAAGRAVPLGMF
ncbi:MAG: amidohydrolase family protein [Chloroflexota bacterium]